MSQALEAPPGRGPARRAAPAIALAAPLLRALLPLVKLRTQLRGLSLGARIRVADATGRILLIRHSYVPGWHFPGGGVEFGETAAEAARRELAEEAGVALHGQPRLVGLYRNPEWTDGDHVAYFQADDWSPCAANWGVEIEAVGFWPADTLPPDAHPSVLRRLAEDDGRAPSAIW